MGLTQTHTFYFDKIEMDSMATTSLTITSSSSGSIRKISNRNQINLQVNHLIKSHQLYKNQIYMIETRKKCKNNRNISATTPPPPPPPHIICPSPNSTYSHFEKP